MSGVPFLADPGHHVPAFLAGWRRLWIVRWARQRIVDPALAILRRGGDPKTLSLSVALGFTLGVFPICGLTAALTACVALLMRSRCNVPIMMIANVVATPVELSLIVPYMRLGETIVGSPSLSLTPDALWKALTGKASGSIMQALFHAVLGWAIVAPFMCWGLYIMCLPAMRQMSRKFSAPNLHTQALEDDRSHITAF
eukprot:SM000001S04513  [mRNA]  locus=s1:600404:601877:- [translate_table: standard]